MTLNEYIRQSYKRPNRRVLEGLGANERLIEYLMETPGNTNWKIVDSIGGGDESKKISLPHTFHFETLKLTENDTEVYCDELDEWISAFNNIGNGNIIKATANNIITIDGQSIEEVDLSDYILAVSEYRKNEQLGVLTGAKTYGWLVTNLIFINKPYDDLTKQYITSYYNDSLSAIDITLDIQEGHIVTILFSSEMEEAAFAKEELVLIKKGGSFNTADFGVSLTDGTNIYERGSIITPTSDMTLTAIPNN